MEVPILYDGLQRTTEESIGFFKRHKHELGHIRKITITRYDMFIEGEKLSIRLSGIKCGYSGTAPHYAVDILAMLGLIPCTSYWNGLNDVHRVPDYKHSLAQKVFTKKRVVIKPQQFKS